jgi:hypothetical protein
LRQIEEIPMKKSLRIALAVVVLASIAPIALAATAPGGGVPQPQVVEFTSWSVIIAAILAWLGF